MHHLQGIPISPGYVSGIAVVYDYDIDCWLEVPHGDILHSEVDSECKRLEAALNQTNRDLESLKHAASNESDLAGCAEVFSVHSAMASDIARLVKQYIGREYVNVEQALDLVIGQFIERLQQLDNAYFRQRQEDLHDVGRRMMRHLSGPPSWDHGPLPPGSVIVAHELLPSETVELAHSGAIGVVSEFGGKNSHAAIVARSLGIPAVTGITNVTSRIHSGVRLLVDGEVGRVIIRPSQTDEVAHAERKRIYEQRATSIVASERLPSVTADGIEISLLANIGRPDEVESVAEHNLGGVGLFRTEFLYLESHERPSAELQLEMYDRMAKGLRGLPLTIRTFDLGGDKLPPFLSREDPGTRNNLHLRGLRFSLAERRLLDTQLRAISHVAQTSDVRILFPMVIGGDDLARSLVAVDKVVARLGLPERPQIGAMIETPAALYFLDEILDLADFVSVGTNDLTQYMLAADRTLGELVDDFSAMHPAVLRAIKQVVETAEIRQTPVCVCGEEAADADFACLLIGLGVRELSVSPARAAAVRHALRHVSRSDARRLADLALDCHTPQQVQEVLGQLRSIHSSSIPPFAASETERR